MSHSTNVDCTLAKCWAREGDEDSLLDQSVDRLLGAFSPTRPSSLGAYPWPAEASLSKEPVTSGPWP